ncbi:MAG: endonuclease V [Acidilobaceae archaeon]|nr:endonuclease V [Acidilobaceae archaeon]
MNRCERVAQNFSPSKAREAQEVLSRLVRRESVKGEVLYVGGIDVSYRGKLGIGVFVIMKYPTAEPLGCSYVAKEACVPYVPGLLAFREMEVAAPLVGAVLRSHRIDLLFVNGHGIAHPRRFGLATHVGLVFKTRTIGVARRRLVGTEVREGNRILLTHEGETVGARLGSFYVSPGWGVTLEEAIEYTSTLTRKGLPEPLRLADRLGKALGAEAGNGGDCAWLMREL